MRDIIFIGDGLGVRTLPAIMMGLNVIGTDISKWAIEHSYCKEHMILDDITNTKIKAEAKVIVAYDILEHLKYEDLDEVLKSIAGIGLNIVVSVPFKGTPNCDGDKTHIIKETKEWWIEKLSKYFTIKEAPKEWLFHEQMLIGERK